jgi:DNA primase
MKYDLSTIRAVSIIKIAQDLGITVKKNKAMCFVGHDKKTPSLSFSEDKNVFNCFGCGVKGSNIGLVMQINRMDFKEAIKWIDANYIGSISWRGRVTKSEYKKVSTERKDTGLYPKEEYLTGPDPEVYEWFINKCSLRNSGHEYLVGRGFTDTTISRFNFKELINPGRAFQATVNLWGIERAERCGLIKFDDENSKYKLIWWDHTILIPFTKDKKVVYIQGRRLPTYGAKYVGMKGITKPIFNAEILLKLKKGETVYICEGVPDAVAACQLGLNSVGILGASSFNLEWLDLFTHLNVYVVPDKDQAGSQFAEKIQHLFASKGKIVQALSVQRGKDLAEYLQFYLQKKSPERKK